MAASDQQILDAARDQLLRILSAGVEEFGEGGESARMLRIQELEQLIARYEARLASQAGPVFRPVGIVDV